MKKLTLFALTNLLCIGSAFAGLGGNITIDNQSPYLMDARPAKTNITQKGMTWNFPETIEPRAASGFYIEFFEMGLCKNNGESVYKITCPNGSIDEITFSASVECKNRSSYRKVIVTQKSPVHCMTYDTHGNDDNIFHWNKKDPNGVTVTFMSIS